MSERPATEIIMRAARAEFDRQAAYRPLYWQFLLWCGRRACSAVLNAPTQPHAPLLTVGEELEARKNVIRNLATNEYEEGVADGLQDAIGTLSELDELWISPQEARRRLDL